jgi:hypothetical protein
MTPKSKIITTVTLLVVLTGLGTADYFYGGDNFFASINDTGSTSSENGSEPAMELPPGAVIKNNGPTLEQTLDKMGLEATESSELSLLAQVVINTDVKTEAILKDGDRAGSVAWVESGNVKTDFSNLKESLLGSFSSKMRDLKDETTLEPGKPVRNVLSFWDPGLSEEKIIIVRIRERLYEFHVSEGQEETMNMLIDELTAQ